MAAFADWWTMTYPQHNNGAPNPLDVTRDGVVIQKLLDAYPVELQEMALLMWQVVPDRNPKSNRSWIALETDRGIRVLERKAAFLQQALSAPEQLTFGPMEEVRLTAREIEEAKSVLTRAYGGWCPHDPKCAGWKDCVREIALSRHIS